MNISDRLTLWQKKYLSRIKTLPEETQLIYIIAMDATYALAVQDAKREEAINTFRMDELDAVMCSVDKWLPDNYPEGVNPATRAADARQIALKAIESGSSEAFGKAIVEELRMNWACDTDAALMILNGAERKMKESGK